MSESSTFIEVMREATRNAVVLFRNNTGMGWIGRSKRLKPGQGYTARGGEVIIFDPRPLHAGLFKGSGDAIGWRSVVITPDMVGKRIAIFVSTETKSARGGLRTEQSTWDENVTAAGGISIVCRSADEFREALKVFPTK